MNLTPFLDPPNDWPSRPFRWNIYTNVITIDTSTDDTAWATSVVKGNTYIVGAALVPTDTPSTKDGLVVVMIKMEGEHGTKDISFKSWWNRMWKVRQLRVLPVHLGLFSMRFASEFASDTPTVVICVKEGVVGAAFE